MGDKSDCRSRTSFVIFMNIAMIQCHSKKQATVEGAVFGSEFLVMKQGIKELRGIRYKLRMMGVGINGRNMYTVIPCLLFTILRCLSRC